MNAASVLARVGVLAGVIGFWLCAHLAASRQPGYHPSVDYLSSLAAHGAEQPLLGIAMFGAGGVALTSAAVLVPLLVSRGGVAAGLLLTGAVCALVAGLLRVECADGAGGCGARPPSAAQESASSLLHDAAVGAFSLSFAGALAALAWAARRDGRRALAVVCLVGAVVPPLLSLDPLTLDPIGLEPGWSQRLWVLAGHLVLVTLALWPRRYGADRARS